jgi:hypothetical protein
MRSENKALVQWYQQSEIPSFIETLVTNLMFISNNVKSLL